MDQGSNKNLSPAYNFAHTVTKFLALYILIVVCPVEIEVYTPNVLAFALQNHILSRGVI